MTGIIVIGLQWGDEGKGKIIDLLASKSTHIVRAQGGNNAGHTIKVADRELAFHLIPSGILYPHTQCYIGGGTMVDPAAFLEELEMMRKEQIDFEGRLFISPYAQVVFPFHRQLDHLLEDWKGPLAIGTTGRGIGPCAEDRYARLGIRISDLLSEEALRRRLKPLVEMKNQILEKLFQAPKISFDTLFGQFLEYGKAIAPLVANVEGRINRALQLEEQVLFEGAHGGLLDLTFGTFPYVTSSSCIAAGVCAGAGVGPTKIGETIGVLKAFTTRVGGGPFPTEFSKDEQLDFMDIKEAREVATTTGRSRRMGWFDAALVRFTIQLSGVDTLALTKLDILDNLAEIKICTGYLLDGRTLLMPPADLSDFERVTPIYETLPGWECCTREIKKWKSLPKNAQAYLGRIEELCNTPIGIVSVGPERERTLMVKEEFDR
jgi:adenylosuccinate synthase